MSFNWILKMFHLFVITSAVIIVCDSFNPNFQTLNYSTDYSFIVNSTLEYILEFSAKLLSEPPRVTIESSNADISKPLMVVARQPQALVSWQVPLRLEQNSGDISFSKISRTLCHDMFTSYLPRGLGQVKVDNPIVSISTFSSENVSFTVRVDYQADFIINSTSTFTISPSEPRYYFYNFSTNTPDSNYETVILKVDSDDSICMTVSIQNLSCPVFDTNEDITFRGFYETISRKGGITIPKYKFPNGFFAVFVAKPDDFDCTGAIDKSSVNRTKTIHLTVEPSISYIDYIEAVVTTLASMGAFYLFFIIGFFFCSKRSYLPRLMEYVSSEPPTPSTPCAEPLDDASVDETEYDAISEADIDKENRFTKPIIYLSDLARRDPRIHRYKSYLYLYNILTIAVFYGLPVIQLVVTYQRVLNETGQQDLCYYNFLCARPMGAISDFNHVFSNSGYVLLGVLFLGITYWRESTHQDLNFERQYGIPQHYGMFYAMGVALITEGVLSGSYHICPNQANFQFDSSFMYVMAVLCVVKLYQNRHPDINATAYATFGVLALAILFGMVGILEGNLLFWITFTVVYLFSCLYLSLQIYYMGFWRLDRLSVMRAWRNCVYDCNSGRLNAITPMHKARMCLLVLGNLCNWALAFTGLRFWRSNFPQFLLAVFMANTLLYFIFYIVMKYINRERVNKLSWFFLVLSLICASSAMYFFTQRSISWSTTPAQSREFNQECKLLKFYDFHDIWHFLSAVGMFFMFMVLLTLDDDLSHSCRTHIVVF